MKHLLVIGGSFAGLTVITHTQNMKITLLDKRGFFEYTPSVFDVLVNPQRLFDMVLDYKQLASILGFKFIQGSLKCIVQNIAYYDDDQKIQFDYCVICTGSEQSAPIKSSQNTLKDRYIELKEQLELIKASQKILILGAGTVGVEAACELKVHYPNLKIAIVTRGSILSTMPEKAKVQARLRMKQLGIQVFEHSKVDDLKSFDYVLNCTGNQYDELTVEKKTQKRFLRNKYFKLQDRDNIYIAGDIASDDLPKTAFAAEMSGEIVAQNIQNVQQRELKFMPNTYIISLGGKKSILVFENLCLYGMIPTFMKYVIERTVIGDFRGNYLFSKLHQLMNFVTYFMYHVYMMMSVIYSLLPQSGRIRQDKREELQLLSKQIGK